MIASHQHYGAMPASYKPAKLHDSDSESATSLIASHQLHGAITSQLVATESATTQRSHMIVSQQLHGAITTQLAAHDTE